MSANPVPFTSNNVPLRGAVQLVAVGGRAMCASLASGNVTSWGHTPDGESTPSSESPHGIMTGFSGVSSIGYGRDVVCGLSGQKVQCAKWVPDLAAPDSYARPVQLQGTAVIAQMAVQYAGVCGLTAAGRVVCWGESTPLEQPEQDIGLTGVTQIISAGENRMCALLSSGAVTCWGLYDDVLYEGNTQTNVPKYQQQAVVGLSGITKIYGTEVVYSENRYTVCGLRANGSAACAASRGSAGTATNLPSPAAFTGLQELLVGDKFVCGRTAAGMSCVGQKPYRLLEDTIGLPLIF